MMVIEKNLEQLTSQFDICHGSLVDGFSLKIQMGSDYYKPIRSGEVLVYGASDQPCNFFSGKLIAKQNLAIAPGEQIITCSKQKYKMPVDYFGLVQTKGTLARLFVSTTCNDGQVEPGFEGYITLEIVNHSPWTIELPVGSDIAQMYLIKCSSPAQSGYNGRYANIAKEGPAVAIFTR